MGGVVRMPRPKRSSSHVSYVKHNLEQIFDNFPDTIFVTDARGNVLLSNSTTAVTLGITLDQLLRSNIGDLVKQGYYNKSYALEAAEKKCPVGGLIHTMLNFTMESKSVPVLDDEGNVIVVITTSNPKGSNQAFISAEERDSMNQRRREIEYLRSCVFSTDEVIAESMAMQKALLHAHAVAQTDSTTVLYGESGTGKEVLAKYIHKHSKRAQEAFIAVNCAAFPEHLVESELFGYEKGAFTGANAEGKVGLFEAAHNGTLFLDEIVELPLPLQSKLLRVLETGEVRRLGSHKNRKIDFRLLAATHKDLRKMTEENTFRMDLYYRLNVIPIHIPPLRERPEDIIALSLTFLERFNKKYNCSAQLDSETLEAFQKYNWPGNVRELRNVVERRVIGSLHKYDADDLTVMKAMSGAASSRLGLEFVDFSGTLKEVMKNVEKRYIQHVLEACNGRIGEAANRLGIYRTVLYRKLKGYEENKG